jgi:hypothetical protein
VYLAARGLRDLDDGEEKIKDPNELAQVRRQAAWVHIESVLSGIILTALSLVIP